MVQAVGFPFGLPFRFNFLVVYSFRSFFILMNNFPSHIQYKGHEESPRITRDFFILKNGIVSLISLRFISNIQFCKEAREKAGPDLVNYACVF